MSNYCYCQDCGAKTVRGSSPVKFCVSCGTPFIKTDQASIKKPQPVQILPPVSKNSKANFIIKKNRNIDEEEDEIDNKNDFEENGEEDDDDTIIPIIDGLEVEIENEGPRKIKIRDIAGSKDTVEPIKDKKVSKISNKEFMKQWAKEAGSIRPKSK